MKTKKSISDDVREAIALRAYFIWEHEGRPEGRGAEHWGRAEAEVTSELTAKKPVTVKKSVKKTTAAKKAPPERPAAKPITVKAVARKKTAKPKKATPASKD